MQKITVQPPESDGFREDLARRNYFVGKFAVAAILLFEVYNILDTAINHTWQIKKYPGNVYFILYCLMFLVALFCFAAAWRVRKDIGGNSRRIMGLTYFFPSFVSFGVRASR